MKRLKTVIHVHTDYSHDSNASARDVAEAARVAGVDCVAVTDHDEIRGALELRDLGQVRVIVGEEISTSEGHLIGLFLKQWIRPGMSAERTAREIRDQNGLALAPHPFSSLCDDSLRAAMDSLAPWLDAVEVCNAQNPLPWQDTRAAAFARQRGLPGYAGADAHIRGDLSACYQLMDDFDDARSFAASLASAELVHGRMSPRGWAVTAWRILNERLAGRAPAGFGVNCPYPQPWRPLLLGRRPRTDRLDLPDLAAVRAD